MVYPFGLSLSCFVIVASAHSGSLNANGGSYTLNLEPPEESTHDVEASLDALMKAEDEKRILSDTAFAAAKQRLINVERQQIQDIVREAFGSADSLA